MYRREYPDIPGMFDARFREYNRPNLYREFQASWLISIVGKNFIPWEIYFGNVIFFIKILRIFKLHVMLNSFSN